MGSSVLQTVPLGPRWPTIDPFLFCAHHDDAYPAGDSKLAPVASLEGRELGGDFSGRDGWNMYHGLVVPGFPAHPHRGFETVTFVRRGLIDHSDSLGAAARFGRGDVQWVTAGKGIVHSEMFPLLSPDAATGNPLELFQIWLNLPAADKLVDPYFTMLWRESLPVVAIGGAEVTVIAGSFGDVVPLAPPPSSWAARPDADVAIWHLRLDPGASVSLPPAQGGPEVARVLYVFEGAGASVADVTVANDTGVVVRADEPVSVSVSVSATGSGSGSGSEEVEILVLQGRPIGEPVAQYGPFVMNTEAEVREAFADYRATSFGGWPWDSDAPHHGRDAGRFARQPDGSVVTPAAASLAPSS